MLKWHNFGQPLSVLKPVKSMISSIRNTLVVQLHYTTSVFEI